MVIKSLKNIDESLEKYIIDNLYAIKVLSKASGCTLKITNNVLNLVYEVGSKERDCKEVVATKTRTHINCTLCLYGDVQKDSVTLFAIKNFLETLRILIKERLNFFFKEKWEALPFILKDILHNFQFEKDIFEIIGKKIIDYINLFVDVRLLGVIVFTKTKAYGYFLDSKLKRYFMKIASNYFQTLELGWIEKVYGNYYLIGKKVNKYFILLVFDKRIHPIYTQAIKGVIGELIGLFLTEELKYTHQKSITELIRSLANIIETRDLYTRGHSEAVAYYSVLIGDELGLSSTEIEELKIAGILHDIGKIGIPDYILFKPGKLLDKEYEIVKIHTLIGAELIKEIDWLSQIAPIVKSHHERWDGNGYPEGLKAEQIPFLARILCIADSFDAMTSQRVYKKIKSKEEALKEIERCAGTQFDPYIAKYAIKALKKYPLFSFAQEESFVPQVIESIRKSYYTIDLTTGYKNFHGLLDDLKKLSYKDVITLLLIDIKKFVYFTLKKGFFEGNTVLKKCAELTSKYFETTFVYRPFSDTFIVILDKDISSEEIKEKIKRIEEELGFGLRYEVKQISTEDINKIEKITQNFKVLVYEESILEHYFEVVQNNYEKFALWNENFKLIASKGFTSEELKDIVEKKELLKPCYFRNKVIGYFFSK